MNFLKPDPDSDSGYCSPKQKPSCVESSPPVVSQTDQPSYTQVPASAGVNQAQATPSTPSSNNQANRGVGNVAQRTDPTLVAETLQTQHEHRQSQLPLQRPTSIPLHAASIVSHTGKGQSDHKQSSEILKAASLFHCRRNNGFDFYLKSSQLARRDSDSTESYLKRGFRQRDCR